MNTTGKRIALVTGANRGIGFEIARRLSAEGMTVVLGVRDMEQGAKAREALAQPAREVRYLNLDVTDETTIAAAIGRIKDDFGRLDVLVNNAGIMVDGHAHILDLSPGIFEKTLATNALGPLALSQACVPLMREHRYGRIVNISSTLGSLSDIISPDSPHREVQSPAYRLSKTLLNGITVLLARELRGTNILVNSVCPGWVRTRMGGEQAPLTPVEAVDTPVWLATLPDDGPTGGFFRERRPIAW